MADDRKARGWGVGMLSLLAQLERLPAATEKKEPSGFSSAACDKARNLAGQVIRDRHLEAFFTVMHGKGEMTSSQIAAALGREISSVNISLRTRLVPSGHVKHTRSEKSRGGGDQARKYYVWNEDRDYGNTETGDPSS